jgi:hypothetical protein
MKAKILVTALISCAFLVPNLCLAQYKTDKKVNMAQALTQPKLTGLLDVIGFNPNKFRMTQSYTLSVGSFGGNSYHQGLYLNTMSYQFSNALTTYLQLGVAHQPLGSMLHNDFGESGTKAFVSGAGLEYRPSDKVSLQVEFSQVPNSVYSPYRYDRFRASRLGLGMGSPLFDAEN